MRKIRLLIANEPEPIGGVTCWRMYWPLDHLQRTYPDLIEVVYSRGPIFPADLYQADVVMCYRPSEPAHMAVIAEAKRLGKPVLLDYDDDLTSIATGHPEYWKLGTKAHIVKSSAGLADEIWCSTEALAKTFEGARTVVIPNAILPEAIAPKPADWKNKTAIWAGSAAHREDADAFKADYTAIIKKVDHFIWVNFMPTWADSYTERARVDLAPWIHTEQYFDTLRNWNTVAIWKPLVSNQFNACKSNIAYITATAVGAVCVTNQAGNLQWEYATRHLPRDEREFAAIWEAAADDVRHRYNLAEWNAIRLERIFALAGVTLKTMTA